MSWTGSFQHEPSWMGLLSWVAALMGVSTGFGSTVSSSPLVFDGLKILLLGSVIETGRRIFQWMVDRFEFRFAVSAEFEDGDISYEWLVNYLMTESVWHMPRNIYVKSKNSQRKWKFQTTPENSHLDYVPDFGAVQFFRWKGYWLEVSRLHNGVTYQSHMGEFEPLTHPGHSNNASIALSVYTRDISVLFAFVEECRLKYLENTKSSITIYSIDSPDYYDGENVWTNVKMKRRRSLDSLLLDEGMIESILADAREFLNVEDWYIQTGIPHRRGYLLYGPPGTGKTSTVYTIAGELGLDIYVLSLSARNMNDDLLAQLVSFLPPKGILLIEDIDCAFPSREELDEEMRQSLYLPIPYEKSQVTMSGLLNVLDGIGSEEGKLFFATTNHIDRLDPALIRPGRIDRKVEYKLASRKQAHALFMRFFLAFKSRTPEAKEESQRHVREVAEEFSLAIPENEFSMAELQGYLLEWKKDYDGAVRDIGAWVEKERGARQERAAREQLRREKAAAAKAQESYTVYEPVIAAMEDAMNHGQSLRPRCSSSASSANGGEAASNSDAPAPRTPISGYGDSEAALKQKQPSLHPSNAVYGAKDFPLESSISDVDIP